jgi:U3 small nucleolar RNA-associated protein 10
MLSFDQMSIVNSMMNARAVSTNPQTFNQALLLVANLSRLAPDSVLHNVMPVFTFMGSNIFHRDDSYSFRVVQKVSSSLEL